MRPIIVDMDSTYGEESSYVGEVDPYANDISPILLERLPSITGSGRVIF